MPKVKGHERTIRAMPGGPQKPIWVTFGDDLPALVAIMPRRPKEEALAPASQHLLTVALKRTLAALKAHVTRNEQWAKAETDPARKKAFEESAKASAERYAAALRTAGQTAIEHKPAGETKAA